jgi:hypothetical protein
LLPLIERSGAATAIEVGLDSLEDRLSSELAERGAVFAHPSLVSPSPVCRSLPRTPSQKRRPFSMTQSLRALLAKRGVSVHGVFPGPVDTDMTRGLDMPKASAESVARAIFDGVERGEEDILPDPVSASLAASWRSGEAKTLERQCAAMAAEVAK